MQRMITIFLRTALCALLLNLTLNTLYAEQHIKVLMLHDRNTNMRLISESNCTVSSHPSPVTDEVTLIADCKASGFVHLNIQKSINNTTKSFNLSIVNPLVDPSYVSGAVGRIAINSIYNLGCCDAYENTCYPARDGYPTLIYWLGTDLIEVDLSKVSDFPNPA